MNRRSFDYITPNNNGYYNHSRSMFPQNNNRTNTVPMMANKQNINDAINLCKKNLSLLSSGCIDMSALSLISEAAMGNTSPTLSNNNTNITIDLETSTPTLPLKSDIFETTVDDTLFDSLLDDKKPMVIENDDDDDDEDGNDFQDFCESFFSEENTLSIPKISSIVSPDLLLSLSPPEKVKISGIKKPNSNSSGLIKRNKKKLEPLKKELQVKKAIKVTAKNNKSKGGKKSTIRKITDNTMTTAPNKFRPYQAEKWKERYEDLLQYRKEHGHCLVPHTYPPNPILARWVKRQRYQYKLFQMKEQSSMTIERVQLLASVGFVWHSHEIVWQERLNELLVFKSQYGHCLVPSNYPFNPKLATWVKCQRRQYKLYLRGCPSNITEARIAILEKHGFEWQLRSSSYSIEKEITAHQSKLRAMKLKNKATNEKMADFSPSSLEVSSPKVAKNTVTNPIVVKSTINKDVGSSTSENRNDSMDFDYFMEHLDKHFSEDGEDDAADVDFSNSADLSESTDFSESSDFSDIFED